MTISQNKTYKGLKLPRGKGEAPYCFRQNKTYKGLKHFCQMGYKRGNKVRIRPIRD